MPRTMKRGHRADLLRWAARLEGLTVVWTVGEAVISLALGGVAGSVALVSFGLQSLVEVIASVAVYVRLRRETGRGNGKAIRRAEELARELVGWSLAALGVFILYEAGGTLWRREPPHASGWGIVLAIVALIGMTAIGLTKRSVGKALGSRAMISEANESLVCALQALKLLGGLALHAWLGWWWADPAAALLMLPVIVRESREALRGGDHD